MFGLTKTAAIIKKLVKKLFFAKIGKYAPCGIFTPGHLLLFLMCAFAVTMLLIFTHKKSKEQIRGIIKRLLILVWILEIFRIAYKLYCGDLRFLESYMPLFFCSIFLYSGLFSSFGKGKLKRAGDVVLATGSLVGGVVFLFYPATSLPDYPAFHFVSVHSFFYHGSMVYAGLLMLISGYIKLKKSDIWLYALSVFVMCMAAFLINAIFRCNLMFISRAFPGAAGKAVFSVLGNFYSPLMVLIHMFAPFYVIYGICKLNKKP